MKPTREDYEDAAARAMLHKGGYAAAVYRNHIRSILRKHERTVPLMDVHTVQPPAGAIELMACLDSLKEADREAILAMARHLNLQDAADSLGLSLSAYKARLARARKRAQALCSPW